MEVCLLLPLAPLSAPPRPLLSRHGGASCSLTNFHHRQHTSSLLPPRHSLRRPRLWERRVLPQAIRSGQILAKTRGSSSRASFRQPISMAQAEQHRPILVMGRISRWLAPQLIHPGGTSPAGGSPVAPHHKVISRMHAPTRAGHMRSTGTVCKDVLLGSRLP